ncbi:MAG: ribosomal protein S18 acetylase RimI-like enzyme [Planctomycetota bacterium]|jgi:ribosomal protein S18 acetylase RimI-like enzyme
MNIVAPQQLHLETLMSWFPDHNSGFLWCGPGFRFPFTRESFLQDMHWGQMPAYALLDESDGLLAFGQYYEKEGRCHLARLVVSPLNRSEGIGHEFILELMNLGRRELNVTECSLFVANANERALKCYISLGFEKAENPPGRKNYADIEFMVRKMA